MFCLKAVTKARAHEMLQALLEEKLVDADLPPAFHQRLARALGRSFKFLIDVAAAPDNEHMARQASSGLYNTASAIILAWEGAQPQGDARKLLVSRMVLEHRVEPSDPLAPADGAWERAGYALLLDDDTAPPRAEVDALLVAA